jgi:signal transduction histidine kinase
VRDTGEGIAPEDLPHVWDRFYRGESARRTDSRGAGLGLSLVKELTEAMGGTVAAESELGQGSCFSIRLLRSEA